MRRNGKALSLVFTVVIVAIMVGLGYPALTSGMNEMSDIVEQGFSNEETSTTVDVEEGEKVNITDWLTLEIIETEETDIKVEFNDSVRDRNVTRWMEEDESIDVFSDVPEVEAEYLKADTSLDDDLYTINILHPAELDSYGMEGVLDALPILLIIALLLVVLVAIIKIFGGG